MDAVVLNRVYTDVFSPHECPGRHVAYCWSHGPHVEAEHVLGKPDGKMATGNQAGIRVVSGSIENTPVRRCKERVGQGTILNLGIGMGSFCLCTS